MNVVIERACIGDAEEILKLQYLCFQREAELYDDYTLPPLKQSLSNLLQEYESHCVLVARCGGEVVGSVRGIRNEGCCHIARLIVHPRMQRQGIGTRLMAAIEREFPDVMRYELFTGTRSEANIRLYQSLGYQAIRTQPVSSNLELVLLGKPR